MEIKGYTHPKDVIFLTIQQVRNVIKIINKDGDKKEYQGIVTFGKRQVHVVCHYETPKCDWNIEIVGYSGDILGRYATTGNLKKGFNCCDMPYCFKLVPYLMFKPTEKNEYGVDKYEHVCYSLNRPVWQSKPWKDIIKHYKDYTVRGLVGELKTLRKREGAEYLLSVFTSLPYTPDNFDAQKVGGFMERWVTNQR